MVVTKSSEFGQLLQDFCSNFIYVAVLKKKNTLTTNNIGEKGFISVCNIFLQPIMYSRELRQEVQIASHVPSRVNQEQRKINAYAFTCLLACSVLFFYYSLALPREWCPCHSDMSSNIN